MSLKPRGQSPLNKDRFPSVADRFYATPTFEHDCATPRDAVIGGSEEYKGSRKFKQ